MNLYEINKTLENLINQADEFGEIPPELEQEILNAEIALEQKALNIAKWIKQQRIEADAIDAEMKRLKSRKQALENNSDRWAEWLEKNLNGQKFKDSQVVISYRKTESVMITEPNKLPSSVWVEKIERNPSKTKIKELIEAGCECDGAVIIERNAIQIK